MRGPFAHFSQEVAVGAPDIDVGERAGDRIEPDREHDDLDVDVPLAQLDPGCRDALDRVGLRVDQFDIVAVVRLEIADVGAGSLGADVMAWAQQGRGVGIVDDLADLVAGELLCLQVGPLVGEEVGERRRQRVDPAALPPLLITRTALLCGDVEGRLRRRRVRHAGVGLFADPPTLRELGYRRVEFVVGKWPVVCRHAVIGRALQDVQLCCGHRDTRNRLDA